MRLTLHLFLKDVRRLWPLALLTWILLAALANADRWRADRIPSPLEGWLNVLLPAAWAALLALVVLEEPLVGDRSFWITRPVPRAALAAAKFAFALSAVHLPLLLADCFILAARGFLPLEHPGALLAQQTAVFAAITLPSLALAAIVRDFAKFVVVLLAIAAVLALAATGASFPAIDAPEIVRPQLIRLVLGVAALAVIAIQYARRNAAAARVLALTGAAAAVCIAAWLPARAEYLFAAPDASLSLRNGDPRDAANLPRWSAATALIPVKISDVVGSFRAAIVDLEVETAAGIRISSVRPSPNRPFEKLPLLADLFLPSAPGSGEWLVLRFSPSAWDQVKAQSVTVRGTAGLLYYRATPPQSLPLRTPSLRCTSTVVDDRYSELLLKVLCESTDPIAPARIALRDPVSGRQWNERLNSAMTYVPGPKETWLSPLNRAQTFFRIGGTALPGDQWRVPQDMAERSLVEITPEIPAGRSMATFAFHNIILTAR